MTEADYIIVGAGSAGCVLANRLSADPTNQVILLEAGGPDRHPNIKIPGAYGKLFRTKIDWAFWSEPQEYVNNRRIYLPRGKTLGGCSSTNAMAYVRGNRADYDGWAALGNEGWDYESVLPYFLKSEHHEHINSSYHGKAGPLHVSHSDRYQTPFSEAFLQACAANGIPNTDDYNGAKQNGAARFQFTIKKGQRQSTATAFLKPVLDRPNLTVITRAQVQQIILEQDKATGVQVNVKQQLQTIKARKEVIVSAGAFHSPQLLLLSGIGEKGTLAQHGITCKHELPGVGKNLQDHLFYSVSSTAHQQLGLNHIISPLPQLWAALQWLISKKGPLTIGPLEAVAFFNLDNFADRVNTQFHFAPLHPGSGYNYDLYDLQTLPRRDGYTILPSLLLPESRGEVSLRDRNPASSPKIQPNFFSQEADLLHLVKAGKKALEVMEHSAFDPYCKAIIAPPNSGSDDAWAEHIRNSVETIYHPVGTCKMGQDEMAVVDDQLRVHQIEGLRVVDASIMPRIVAGNTNAPVIMIAEKAADLILHQAGN
ncbi:MAG: GMC family oxidoreductase N-terminal domain-containing protein [Bacteroidota bacterium]